MTQIKATLLTGGNHIETVSFPCSDDEIMRLTEQNEIGHKATVFINNLIGPKGLKSMEGTYANIHELNYLAKRMDSFDGTEMGKLLAAASRFDTRDLRQLINYTFNLGRITLIQNISDMQNVGVEHYMDIHGGCCSNEEYRDPKRAEEGRALLNSKRGIWTDYGLMFINDEVPWEEVYNGITFPEYRARPLSIERMFLFIFESDRFSSAVLRSRQRCSLLSMSAYTNIRNGSFSRRI